MAVSEVVGAIPESLVIPLVNSLDTIVYLIGAIGVFAIAYMVFMIISTIIQSKRNKRIEKIASDVEVIKKYVSKIK